MASPAGPQFIQVIDTTGPQAGATIEYYSLADVPQAVYSDAALGSSLGAVLNGANASDSKGRFPIHFLNTALSYKRIIKLSDGTPWRTDNPVQTADTSIATALAAYVPLAGATMTGALNLNEAAPLASAATINLDIMTGTWGHVTGTTGISTMTLAAGWRILVFDGALTLTNGANLILPGSANITTVAGDSCLVIGEDSGVTRMVAYWLVDGRSLVENAEFLIAASDESTNLTAGTAKVTWRMPYAMTLTSVPRGSLTTAQTAGSLLTIDINESGTTLLSTKLTFDNNETTTETAATPAVLSDTAIADNAEMTIDIDTVGTAGAKGLKILLRGIRRNR